MADQPPYSTPRWVKIVGIIALVLVLLVGIMLLAGVGGEHGPGRHRPSGDAGETALSSVTGDHVQSGGGPIGKTPSTAQAVQQL